LTPLLLGEAAAVVVADVEVGAVECHIDLPEAEVRVLKQDLPNDRTWEASDRGAVDDRQWRLNVLRNGPAAAGSDRKCQTVRELLDQAAVAVRELIDLVPVVAVRV